MKRKLCSCKLEVVVSMLELAIQRVSENCGAPFFRLRDLGNGIISCVLCTFIEGLGISV